MKSPCNIVFTLFSCSRMHCSIRVILLFVSFCELFHRRFHLHFHSTSTTFFLLHCCPQQFLFLLFVAITPSVYFLTLRNHCSFNTLLSFFLFGATALPLCCHQSCCWWWNIATGEIYTPYIERIKPHITLVDSINWCNMRLHITSLSNQCYM